MDMSAADTLGTGWGFPPQFFNNGKDVAVVSDADDIKESLEILFSTIMQERLYHSDFGCDLQNFMFEDIDRGLVMKIQQMIQNAIYDYEPRIKVEEITVTESDEEAHVLLIHVNYLIKSTNSRDNLNYSLSLY
jgi:phage baseplate assembly protein W